MHSDGGGGACNAESIDCAVDDICELHRRSARKEGSSDFNDTRRSEGGGRMLAAVRDLQFSGRSRGKSGAGSLGGGGTAKKLQESILSTSVVK